MSIRKDILLRVRISFLLIAILGGAILYKLGNVLWVEGEQWTNMGQNNAVKIMTVPAIRGNIYSDNGSLLATSIPFYRIALDPSIATDELFNDTIDSLSVRLATYFKDQSSDSYKEKILRARKAGRKYIKLSNHKIGYQDKKLMEKWPLIREGKMRGGVIFEKVNERFRPFSTLGYRTIGRVNTENRGTVGIEYSFNKQLAGQQGKGAFKRMTGGSWRPIFDGSEIKAKDGYDVVTTLNVDLQDITETALRSALKTHLANYGVAVLMEVTTGEIKAISNLSRTESGLYFEKYNYAVGSQGSQEPGSTFKLASMIALLEKTSVRAKDTVDTGDGQMKFFDRTMKDHKTGGFGKITVQEVFEKSSNIGIAKLIVEHFGKNSEKFIQYLSEMNLTEPLGFQMVGEGVPYIKHPSDTSWSGVTLPWMSYGYELKMTPLQTLTLFNAVANNGRMIQPIIVRSVNHADREIQKFKSKVLNERICSKKTLDAVKSMLEGVVRRGTARNISDSKYLIAGKTGTAKKVIEGKYTNKYYTSFVGYFPADKPKYSAIVVIDDPKGYQINGSDVAAPVFKEIADNIYAFEIDLHEIKEEGVKTAGIFPIIKSGNHDDLKYLCNELGILNHSQGVEEWVKTNVVGNSVSWKDNKIDIRKMPDVKGMTLRDAVFVLENLGLKVLSEGTGRVSDQSELPGTDLNRVRVITLRLS